MTILLRFKQAWARGFIRQPRPSSSSLFLPTIWSLPITNATSSPYQAENDWRAWLASQ